MGAAKESPATQVLDWAVGKLDEASRIDWLEKLSAMTASKPAYLRNGLLGASAPSMPAPTPAAPSDGGVSQAELDRAVARAAQAEGRADSLARRVAQLEQKLAGQSSRHEVSLADDEEGDQQKSHWWSRQH